MKAPARGTEEPLEKKLKLSHDCVNETPQIKCPRGKNENEMWALHANLNGYKTHGIKIEAELELMPRKPELLFLN